MRYRSVWGLFACLFVFSASPARAEGPKIIEVTSPHGIKAWLVEDHHLPLVSMHFAFRGGVETDPANAQGLSVLSASMLTQGAGPYDERAFQDRLAARSIHMDISAGRDYVAGEVKTLRGAKDEAFRLLGLALTKPRMEAATFDRVRATQFTAAKAQLASPSWQGRVALYTHIFKDHPYSFRSLGSLASVKGLTREQAVRFVHERLARDNLSVAVVGAISPAELSRALDTAFGGLPAQAAPVAARDVIWPEKAQTIVVSRDGPQTNIQFALPMIKRDDPDWYAVQIANYILGGGGFISRLMKEVRAQEGLTYGISTGVAAMKQASVLTGAVATDNEKVGVVLSLLRRVLGDFYAKGVTADEVTAAQDYMTGSLPLALTSTDAIAGTLLAMQTENLGIDYLDKQSEKVRKVTLADVQRVIAAWFDPSRMNLSLVGQPQGVEADQTRSLIKE